MSKENVSKEIEQEVVVNNETTENVTEEHTSVKVDIEDREKRPKTFMEKAAKSATIWRPVAKRVLEVAAGGLLIYGAFKVGQHLLGKSTDDSEETETIDGEFTVNE